MFSSIWKVRIPKEVKAIAGQVLHGKVITLVRILPCCCVFNGVFLEVGGGHQ